MKKIFSRVVLCVLMAVASTASYAQKQVLAEDFGQGALPEGWTTSNNSWRWSNGEAVFNALVENGVDTLFTPVVNAASLDNQPTITLDYRMMENRTNVNPITVLYRTSLTEAWTELETITTSTEDVVRTYILLPATVTADLQVAIAVQYNLGGETAIGYVAIENQREGVNAPQNLRSENLTTNSVELYWDASTSDMFVQNYLKVSTEPLEDVDGAQGDVYDGPVARSYYSLENLAPNTTYYVYVRYEFEDNDYSAWGTLVFRTSCEAITVPYTEDFETELSACYTIVNDTAKLARVNGAYPYNSTRAFQFVTRANRMSYLFLPELDADVKGYQITFMVASDLAGNTYGRDLAIGVATDATAETFTELKNITLPAGRRWEKVTVSLAGYKGTGRVIAFRSYNATKENHIVIDDIKIEPASACPMPMFVQATEITATTAKLSWVEAGNASEWNVVLATREYRNPEDCEEDEAKAVSSNPYVATGLLPNTTYYVYVQSGCGSSEWTAAYSFKTQRAIKFPYAEGFDRFDADFYTNTTAAVPDAWVMGARGTNDAQSYSYDKEDASYAAYISTTLDHTSSAYTPAALLLRGTSGAYVSYAMMPAMPAEVDLSKVMVSFYAHSGATSTQLVVGVADLQSNEIEQGKQLVPGGNITPVDTLSFAAANQWQKMDVYLGKYAGTGKYITFYLIRGSATPAVYVDDITIDYAPACFKGKELTAETTGTQTANIAWKEIIPTEQWKIKLSSSEIDPAAADGDVLNTTTVATDYAFTGLVGNTTYYVYVSPTCGEEWISTTFTTLYAIKDLPYYNDFTDEPTGSGKKPNCWLTGNAGGSTSTTYMPYVNTSAWSAATGAAIPSEVVKPSLYFYGGTTITGTAANNKPYAIMPEMAGADVKDLTLSFWGHTNNTTASNGRILRIGVLDDPTDMSTLTYVTTVRVKTIKVPEFFVVDMSSYTGTGKYIVFYSDTTKTNYFFMDNLSITLSSKPQRVTDVTVEKIGQDTATIAWKENGMATAWEVRLFSQKPEDIDTATPDKAYTAVTTNPLKVTGLAHSTYYYVYVRSVQGTETGAWSAVQNFWTATGTWQVPFEENFDAYPTGGTSSNTLSPYYDVSASTAGNYPYVRSYVGASVSEKERVNIYYFTASSSKKVSQLEFPPFDQPVNTLQMALDACSYSTYGGVQSKTIFGVVTADGVFHTVATRELGATKVWEPWLVDFSSYSGEEGRIAIRQEYSETDKKTVYIFIDNVKIDVIPQCKQVQEVNVKKITQTGATVSWKAAGEETVWNLKVSTTELEDPSAATADVFDGQMTVTTKDLTDLASGTDHFVYVQSVRADKDCVGEWSRVAIFTTLCSAMPRPYTETFDDMESNIVPPCFTLSGKVADNTATYISTVSGISGKVLRLSQVDKTYNNYCALPLVQCNSVKDLQLKMQVMPGSWGSATSKSIYFYEIGIMTEPADPSTYVAVLTDSVVADGSKVPIDKRYTFDNYAGDELGNMGKYIAIRVLPYRSSINKEYTGTLYIDNIEIGDKELCLQPTELRVAEYDNDTVRLTWKAKDKTGTFRVRVFTDAEAGPETFVAEQLVNDTTVAVLKGLDGNTFYYASVRHECGDKNGNSKWSTFISWRSDCEDIQTLPYVDDFEYGVTSIVPYCWMGIEKTYVPTGAPESAKTTLTAKLATSDGNTYLSIGGATSGSIYYAQAITPQLDIDNLSNTLIYFDVKASSADAKLRIEAMESTAEDAATIVIHTIEGIQSNKWQTVYLDLADYYTSAQPYKYLRLAPVAGKTVYIDNLHITTNKAEVLPVSEVAVKDLSLRETSVDISFTESTPGVAQWIVEYGPTGYEAGTGTSVTLDTTYCRLTGLQPATAYDVYVRGNVEGSPLVGPLKFTTTKAFATLPYYYGFEDAAENADLWTLYNNNANDKEAPNTFTFGPAANVDGTGTTALYIQHNGEYGYIVKDENGDVGTSHVWATRYIDIPAAGTYEIGLRAKSQGNLKEGEEDNDYFVVCLVPSDRTFSGSSIRRPDGTTGSATLTTNTSLNEFNVLPKSYGITDYQMLSGKVVIANPGAYQLAIYWYNPAVGVAGKPLAVDSIWVEEYDCTTPSDHQLTQLTDTSATVSWFAGKNDRFEVIASRYRRSLRPNELEEEDKIVHETYTGQLSFTVKGLLPNTTYAFYQRTICEDGPTDWVEFDFTTNCIDETLPYTETFAETPPCWTYSSTAVKATTVKYRSEEMEANKEDAEIWSCLYIPANGIAVLPDFGVDITKLAVQINAFNVPFDPAQLILGTVENTWDLTTFEQVALCDLKTQYSVSSGAGNPLVLENFEKFFNLYTGKGKYIALKAANVAVYIKSITVTELPDCITPQQIEVTDVLESSATIHWLAGSEQSWRIACGGDTIIVSEQPYTLTGLRQGEDYKVSVQALCDEDGQSDWSKEVAFTTQCGLTALPLIDDFASRVDTVGTNYNFTLANCWQQLLSTVSFDSLARQSKPAMEVLERLPKQTKQNYYKYYDYKWGVPYSKRVNEYFNGKAHIESSMTQDETSAYYGTYYYKWLLLPAVTADANAIFSFDLAWANMQGCRFYWQMTEDSPGTYKPVDPVDFRVVVTADGGNTFEELQKINLAECDSTFQRVAIDLSDYAGKDIQVGFYQQMRYHNAPPFNTPDIRLADIRINYVDTTKFESVACLGHTYEGYGFVIPAEDLPAVGESKTFERRANNVTNTGNDGIIVLTLTTVAPAEETIYASICEGTAYEVFGVEYTVPAADGKPYQLLGETVNGCDSIVYLYLTVSPYRRGEMIKYINEGHSYDFNGKLLTEAGTYRDTIQDSEGVLCDSIITLTLVYTDVKIGYEDMTVCPGDLPLMWKGIEITQLNAEPDHAARFDTLSTIGTDSVVWLNLYLFPAYDILDSEVRYINEGSTYEYEEHQITKTGRYSHTYTTVNGCDSTVTIEVIVMGKRQQYENISLCRNELPYLWKEMTIMEGGVYSFDTLTTVGTDSVVILMLDVLPTYEIELQQQFINEGETFRFAGRDLSGTGVYYDSLLSLTGCDSIVKLPLIVMTERNGYETLSVCPSELPLLWKGMTITESGVYSFDTLTSVGTDSIVVLTLTTLPTYEVSIGTRYINAGDTYDFFGEQISQTGTYRHTLQTINGCDSIISINLIAKEKERSYEYASICPSELPYLWNGQEYTETGYYQFDTLTSVGTDSLVTLSLTVWQSYERVLPAKYINEGETYEFCGKQITQTGNYSETLQTIHGCDSIVSVSVVFMPKSVVEERVAVCDNELPYLWKGQALTNAGIYTFDTLTTVGTDSVVSLTLNVFPTYQEETTAYINAGDTYWFIDRTLTESGTYTETLQTVNGCDSVLTLRLVVMPKQTAEQTLTVCDSELPYLWKGQSLTEAGTYTFDTLTTVGTDSVLTLTLVVNTTIRIEEDALLCPGESLRWEGKTITEAGEYLATYTAISTGCDSTLVLHVTMAEQTVIEVDTVILTTELPFVYLGEMILRMDTPEGHYDETLSVPGEPCATIYNLHITVKMPDGIANVATDNLRLYPTMIAVGDKVNLWLPQADGMTVTVLNTVGDIVATYQPADANLVLDEFYTAGIYLIRVTSASGYNGLGKVVAK